MNSNAPAPGPGAALPLVHVALAAVAAALVHAPLVTLPGGGVESLRSLAGGWAIATLVMLGVVGAAAVLLRPAGRLDWARLLVVDVLVVVALIPVVIGALVHWEAPGEGAAQLAWGFWGAMVFLAARVPFSLYIRRRAARAGAQAGDPGTGH